MLHSPQEILKHEVQKLYSIEVALVDSLKMLEGMAFDPQLKTAFAEHRQETETHVTRLTEICRANQWTPVGIPSQIIKALEKETLETLNGAEPGNTTDVLLIDSAQKAEHLEIASYGTVRTMFETLGDQASASILEQTLQEEKQADEKLSTLSKTALNGRAFVA